MKLFKNLPPGNPPPLPAAATFSGPSSVNVNGAAQPTLVPGGPMAVGGPLQTLTPADPIAGFKAAARDAALAVAKLTASSDVDVDALANAATALREIANVGVPREVFEAAIDDIVSSMQGFERSAINENLALSRMVERLYSGSGQPGGQQSQFLREFLAQLGTSVRARVEFDQQAQKAPRGG